MLNQLANPGKSRKEKDEITNIIKSYCVHFDVPVSGEKTDILSQFIATIRIESSDYTDVTVRVNINLNNNGKITELKVLEFEKTEK